MQVKKLVSMASRTGRELQRYNFQGCRQVVGCIPYRIKNKQTSLSIHGTSLDQLEFLLISSQKSSKWMFPKGGWEKDETKEEAAVRETIEEAGVVGKVENPLGIWTFKSKSQDKWHEGHMLSFKVTDELDVWPEKDVRRRIWVSASEAREKCEYLWMKMALDTFIHQVNQNQMEDEELKVAVPTEEILSQSEEEEEEDSDPDILSLTQLQMSLFISNEPVIRVVAQEEEEEEKVNALPQLVQMTRFQRKEEERVMPCCLDYRMGNESRMAVQSGEKDAILSCRTI